jgi:hypothetical protein
MSEVEKDNFYEKGRRVFYQFARYNMKILLGSFNANEGTEYIFIPTLNYVSSHKISNDNGVNFATSKNLVVKSSMFSHRNSWTSPQGNTHNQTDHFFIDRRRHLNLLMSDLLVGLTVILTTTWWCQKLWRERKRASEQHCREMERLHLKR